MKTILFGCIVIEHSSHEKTQRGVKATLSKQECGTMWNRLIGSQLQTPWLTRDFDSNWFESDDEDEDAVMVRSEPWVDPSKFYIYYIL